MNRRLSLEKQGPSPTGSFLTPSPSPSIPPASPRLQPSPSQSPFQSDVIVVGSASNQETERKVSTPLRRPSFNQISSSNTSAVVFRPSPTQSPAAATTVVSVVGNEFNTTLVGSNNISLNKKGKRTAVNQHGIGSASIGSNSSKASSKKGLSAGSVAASSSLRSPPPPLPQQDTNFGTTYRFANVSNQNQQISYQPNLVQGALGGVVLQGSTLIAQQQQHHHHQHHHHQQQQQQNQNSNQYVPISSATSTPSKQNKILPKPSISNTSSSVITTDSTTNPITASTIASQQSQQQTQLNTNVPMQSGNNPQQQQQHQQQQHHHHHHQQQQSNQQNAFNPSNPIILLNQMPVILQQPNTPQGVQLILRPPTPQIAVIHNTRPQIQAQQQPQQLLRIVNANGQMQLAAATPTFIVSSQSNSGAYSVQNLQGIKAQTTNPLNPLQGLTSQAPQQLAAAINSQLIGRSMAQLQNLQLNGNLAQIQMQNGLNGQFISQLPAQFQQNVTGFNQFNQLSSTNFQQLATATATGAFQSPPPQQQSTNDMVVAGPNIQFTTQQAPISVSVAQTLPSSQIIAVPASHTPQQTTQLIPTTIPTPEPIRNPTPITILPNNTVPIIQTQPTNANANTNSNNTNVTAKSNNSSNTVKIAETDSSSTTKKSTRKPKKPKTKKDTGNSNQSTATIIQTTSTSQIQNNMKFVQTTANNPPSSNMPVPTSQSNQTSQLPASVTTSTGKLDLANVMKLCGIMDDDDFMDADETIQHVPPPPNAYDIPTSMNSTTSNDIMVTIPYVQNSDTSQNRGYSFTIPSIDGGSTTNASYPVDTKQMTPKSNNDTGNTANVIDTKIPSDRQYMIKIDNNDGTPPFPLSITLPHNLNPTDNNDCNKIVSMSSIQPTPVSSSGLIQTTNQTIPIMNTVTTPALQGQMNKIQNQLIGNHNNAIHSMNLSQSMNTITTVTSSSVGLSTANLNNNVANTAQKSNKKKQTNKRNGKKVMETINVPSQIGNIQISQVDRTKCTPNHSGKAIENQIQITPIIESIKPSVSSSASITVSPALVPNQISNNVLTMTPTQTQQVSHTINNLNNSQTMAMNIQQQNHHQSILNIPNNVQIISSSSTTSNNSNNNNNNNNNNLNTHSNLITSSILPNVSQSNSGNGGVLINTTQSFHPQIGMQQRSSTLPVQSSNIQTINNQGNLMNTNAQMNQTNSAQRQIQMTMQTSQPNIQMHMLPTTATQQMQPNDQAPQLHALPQLTGSLTLSFSEDGRLLLKHNPNAPQDSQSQMILQAILSGALSNVTLINELPTTTTQYNTQQPNIMDGNKSSLLVKTNDNGGAIPRPTILNNPMPTNTNDKQQMGTSQSIQKSFPNVIQNQPIQNQAMQQQQTHPNVTGGNQTMQTTTIELPKIGPNQQLFSLNTITNQITQLSPGLTTAALGPMERLLIVPAGVNKQQLAKCLIQGQIHFDNIGQATQANETKQTTNLQMNTSHQGIPLPQPTQSIQPQINPSPSIQQQQQQQQQQKYIQLPGTNVQSMQTTPIVKSIGQATKPKPEAKPKKTRTKKPKAELSKTIKSDVIIKSDDVSKKEKDNSKIANKNNFSGMDTAKLVNDTQPKSINVAKICNSVQSLNSNYMNTTSMHSSVSNTEPIFTTSSSLSSSSSSSSSLSTSSSSSSLSTPTKFIQPSLQTGTDVNASAQKNLTITVNTTQSNVPPLISVNQTQMMVSPTHMPRVQTIQLTPQKQQSLKTVQMQIQTLSSRLQNKSLLSSIRPDMSPSNPLYNKPLPTLSNINAMNDMEIYQALQRLFIEQQKILATGKIISTLPAGSSFAANIPVSAAPIITNQQPASVSPNKKINIDPKACAPIVSVASQNKLKNSYPSRLPPRSQSLQPVCIVSPQLQQRPQPTIAKCEVTTSTVTSNPIVSPVVCVAKEIPKQSVDRQVQPAVQPTQKIQQQKPEQQIPKQPTVPRTCLFENQLKVDQEGCLHPDYQSPFQSKEDAVKRLIRYHCLYSENEPDNENQVEVEEKFVNAAIELKNKYNSMINKYQMLLMKDSMRHVRTSELMMLDRIFVSDIQEEITSIQMDLKTLNEEIKEKESELEDNFLKDACPMQQQISDKLNLEISICQSDQDKLFDEMKDNCETIDCGIKPNNLMNEHLKKFNFERNIDLLAPAMDFQHNIKNEIKGEQDLISNSVNEFNKLSSSTLKCGPTSNPTTPHNITNTSSIEVMPMNAHDIDVKPTFQQMSNKENTLPQLDMNFSSYDSQFMGSSKRPNQNHFDVKKELDNLDIESEITPSYIIKNKCEPPNRDCVSHSPLSSSDFDYFCSQSESGGGGGIVTSNQTGANRRKDELINSCDKEPYDEWLCIQKELNLITDKRSADHLNIDGFMESTLRNLSGGNDEENPCSSSKLDNVDTHHFNDIFNQQTNDGHSLDDEKSDIDSHLPLSELFNDTIVNNSVDNVDSNDKSVESRLENMFNDESEFDKTNDLVESRLEELFHGSSPTTAHSAMNSSQVDVGNHQSFQVGINTEFMLNAGPHQSSTAGQNKRHWSNDNGDILPQMNINQLHPSKRSCMMTTFMESTNSTDEHQWMMEVQQSTSYDFMTGDNHNDSNVNKRTWNGNNGNDMTNSHLLGNNGNTGIVINGLTCDNNDDNDLLMDDLDNSKKQCFDAMSVKANDLERDLLGLSTNSSPSSALDNSMLMQLQQNHLHGGDNVYQSASSSATHQTASINANNDNVGGNPQSNNSNTNMTSSFDDDINQHVQNAIDSILNLQNSENESLHYLDQTMGSFLSDSPLTPNMIHQQTASGTDFHYVSSAQATHQNQHSPFMS